MRPECLVDVACIPVIRAYANRSARHFVPAWPGGVPCPGPTQAYDMAIAHTMIGILQSIGHRPSSAHMHTPSAPSRVSRRTGARAPLHSHDRALLIILLGPSRPRRRLSFSHSCLIFVPCLSRTG
jgi:hypothetical protein